MMIFFIIIYSKILVASLQKLSFQVCLKKDAPLTCKKQKLIKQIMEESASSPINVLAIITIFWFNAFNKILW